MIGTARIFAAVRAQDTQKHGSSVILFVLWFCWCFISLEKEKFYCGLCCFLPCSEEWLCFLSWRQWRDVFWNAISEIACILSSAFSIMFSHDGETLKRCRLKCQVRNGAIEGEGLKESDWSTRSRTVNLRQFQQTEMTVLFNNEFSISFFSNLRQFENRQSKKALTSIYLCYWNPFYPSP